MTISVLGAVFAKDIAAMAWQWINSSTYQHCLFIVPLICWLVCQRRRELIWVEPRCWAPGLVALCLAAFCWLIGEAAGVSLVRHFAVIAMIQAAILTSLGPAVVRALLFPIFYLVFLVPVGDEIVPAMQTLTANMTMTMLDFAGVPAKLDGVFITTPTGWFKVAEACAGVKFLVAMIAYGALVANVCFRRWQRRTLFMLLCFGAPILANGMRAFGTIYAAHLTSVEAATGFDHIVYGWFFFAFVMMAVMAVSWRFFDRRLGDVWLDRVPAAIGKPRSMRLMTAASIGVFVLPVLWNETVVAYGRSDLPHPVTLPDVPGWTRVSNAAGHPWVPRFDGADHELLGRYRNADGNSVDLGIALYGWQGDGRKIVGYGQGAIDPDSDWSWSAKTAAPPGGKGQRMLAPGKIEREALTFYSLGPSSTGDILTVKWRTLQGRLVGGNQTAAVIIISAQGNQRIAMDRFLKDLGPVHDCATKLIATARGQ